MSICITDFDTAPTSPPEHPPPLLLMCAQGDEFDHVQKYIKCYETIKQVSNLHLTKILVLNSNSTANNNNSNDEFELIIEYINLGNL